MKVIIEKNLEVTLNFEPVERKEIGEFIYKGESFKAIREISDPQFFGDLLRIETCICCPKNGGVLERYKDIPLLDAIEKFIETENSDYYELLRAMEG